MLKFDGAWRFKPPPDGRYKNQAIPRQAINEFYSTVVKVAKQRENRQPIIERYKRAFCNAIGSPYSSSSSESWAESDLASSMRQCAENAPLFLEAIFDASQSLSEEDFHAPDEAVINDLCNQHDIGYEIREGRLLLREKAPSPVSVPQRPPSLAVQAVERYQQSLHRSEELLAQGKTREAVQELLWLLESVVTAFRGLDVSGDLVRGKYFNQIARELRASARGTVLDRVVDWLLGLHGYLSSPTGGGVRHGMDLNAGIEMSANEAQLFCNLIRSYLSFLLAEHERLT